MKTRRNAYIVLGLCFILDIILRIPDGITFNLPFILIIIGAIGSPIYAFIIHKKIKNMEIK